MELLPQLIDAGVLVTPEILEELSQGIISEELKKELSAELLKQLQETIAKTPSFEQAKEAEHSTNTSNLSNSTSTEQNIDQKTPSEENKPLHPGVQIKFSYDKPATKRTYDDFVCYFKHRYTGLMNLLKHRTELQGVTSISRILAQKGQQNIALIGMVSEKTLTKNNNIILKLEDLTGEITVIITGRDNKLLEQAQDLVLDEVIGITGGCKDKTVFADKVLHPDVPLSKELKKQKEEEYLIVIGDAEIGGTHFLKDEWEQFIAWLNGEVGTEEQRRIAKKVRYIVMIGDCVSGHGIYPGQEHELEIKDIHDQYEQLGKYLIRFPKEKEIIICPGNHDAGRIADPQPVISKKFAQNIHDLPNVSMVSSPSVVTIGATDTFSGFELLLYHGYSIIYYSDNIPSVRNAGGQKATDRIMKFLLQRRHLAPTHGCNLYIPDNEEDPLIIKSVPDFFLTGHIHRIATANYRNVTLINAGCWTDITENQIKRGLEPQPARLPIINLQTRAVTIMNFYQDKEKKEERLGKKNE